MGSGDTAKVAAERFREIADRRTGSVRLRERESQLEERVQCGASRRNLAGKGRTFEWSAYTEVRAFAIRKMPSGRSHLPQVLRRLFGELQRLNIIYPMVPAESRAGRGPLRFSRDRE
jgi:hypothetical protein